MDRLPTLYSAYSCRARTGAATTPTGKDACPHSEDGSHGCDRDALHENGPLDDRRGDHHCLCGLVWLPVLGGITALKDVLIHTEVQVIM